MTTILIILTVLCNDIMEERTWFVRSEVLTAVLVKIQFFRDMMLHLLDVGDGCCLGSGPEIFQKM